MARKAAKSVRKTATKKKAAKKRSAKTAVKKKAARKEIAKNIDEQLLELDELFADLPGDDPTGNR